MSGADGVFDANEVRRLLQRRRRETGEDFQQLLERYALDRFLHRLGRSRHRPLLVLKGAVLFSAWFDLPHRPTRDIDFALVRASGDSDTALVEDLVTEVCRVEVDEDGIVFDTASITSQRIREGASYAGVRVMLFAGIGTARVRVQVDVGFGDVIVPGPREVRLPALLDQDDAIVLAYPRAVVVAEKLEIIAQLGVASSRMKDYFDLHALARGFDFDGVELAEAVRATFARRGTAIPRLVPPGLADDFANDASKLEQWNAFRSRIRRDDELTLQACIAEVRRFALPVFEAAVDANLSIGSWRPATGWTHDTSAKMR
jgi:hypothetical protein